MIVLGINDGHNASAALLIDGVLVAAVSEDRPSRQTYRTGFPADAIKQCLEIAGIQYSDIDHVALATAAMPPWAFLVPHESFSVEDYRREQTEYWYPRFYGSGGPGFTEIFQHKIDRSRFPYDESLIKDEDDCKGMLEARLRHLEATVGIGRDRISVHDHHTCHAYYGHLTHPERDQELLVFTTDGGGDKCNGTVWRADPGQRLQQLKRSANCNIARLYRYVTLILGMKQFEHVHKVMGLAPYANERIGRKAHAIFAETLQVDGLGFSYDVEPKDHYFYFKEKLDGIRFDGIAWGIQKRVEELLSEWVLNGVRETGIGHVAMSGGVAMNIKANKIIWELDEVRSIFVPPGPGDESISIGAAFKAALDDPRCDAERIENFHPFQTAYLGPAFSDADIARYLKHIELPSGCRVREAATEHAVDRLAAGQVVARFAGRAEFGPRALGNRSILANPRDPRVVKTINEMIKQRDFWMPFAASILAERAGDYLVNPKSLDGSFMTVAFESTPLAHEHLPGGLHPYDLTSRPQIVRKDANPGYHALISAFEGRTGVGALLNTSFNLHGEPIVATPADAISTFERSGLQHLLLGSFLISKPDYAMSVAAE